MKHFLAYFYSFAHDDARFLTFCRAHRIIKKKKFHEKLSVQPIEQAWEDFEFDDAIDIAINQAKPYEPSLFIGKK